MPMCAILSITSAILQRPDDGSILEYLKNDVRASFRASGRFDSRGQKLGRFAECRLPEYTFNGHSEVGYIQFAYRNEFARSNPSDSRRDRRLVIGDRNA